MHKRFSHPRARRLKALLQDAGVWDEQCQNTLDKIDEKCETCVMFRKTAPRPVVGVSLAQRFNEASGN